MLALSSRDDASPLKCKHVGNSSMQLKAPLCTAMAVDLS